MTPEKKEKPNRLFHATSPYLLQHAYNPVDWFEWGPEALTKAKKEDKPILVSIGYSSCHWCHVMEHESFEKDDIAQLMNLNFVCIKVDREERPDIDHVYMEAVQAMGVNGGWPLNVFLTPDQKPFYGGTYFPSENWARLLLQIHQTFLEKRKEIEDNAGHLSRHLNVSDLQRFGQQAHNEKFSLQDIEKMVAVLESRFDQTWGGLDKAPKFVMPTIWLCLLRHHAVTKNPETLRMVEYTLLKMQEGGLYDQLGGGFARYSVDSKWFAPHFEKMLYDNAQLLSLYAEAFSITKNPVFKTIAYETIGWLRREMTHPGGGFYSALDADSEGSEGKFYTWTYSELEEVLGEETGPFTDYFHCTREGNWEHGRNILMRNETEKPPRHFEMAKERLLKARNARVRPGLDDKILTGWNALMIKGLTDAYRAWGETEFLDVAEASIRFIEQNLIHQGRAYRSFKDKQSSTEGFLEDYAFLIQAYSSLYHSSFKEDYLDKAKMWCDYVLIHFTDKKDGYFHFSAAHAEQLIAQKKEIFDNVIPSSNSVMARNLFHLGVMLDIEDWKQKAIAMVSPLISIIRSEPGYLSNWGILVTEIVHGMAEVVIVGPRAEGRRQELASQYLPFALLMGTTSKSKLSLFEGRSSRDDKTRIYVCFNKTCQRPVETSEEAIAQLN